MRKRYVLLVLIIISVVIFNVPKSYANNKLDSIELKENNEINKKAFAMYVENGLNTYEPYTEDSNYFPNSLKYHYNSDMSKCVDNNDKVVEGILKHNEDNSVTVTSNRTVYCYLYFDSDKDKPGTPEVNLSNVSSIDNNYTNSKIQTVTVTYSEDDIESYCISLNSDTCTSYVTTGLDTASKKITLSNYDLGTDGNKTISVWLKDMAGNISETSGSITKTLDTQPPVINNLTVSGVTTYSNVNYVTTASPSVTITWTDNEIDSYCIGASVCTPNTKYSGTNKQGTSSIKLNEGANTIHAKIIDKAGNVSVDKTYTLTVDTIAPGTPTVSINSNAGYTQSEKVNVNVTGIASDAAYYCTDYTGSCAPTIANKNTSLTLSNQTITKTEGNQKFCVRIKDKAGNIGTAGCDTIYLDLNNPIVGTPTSSSVSKDTIVVKGTSSDAGGIKTVTCKNNKNVGTCTCSGTTSYTCTNSGLAAGTAYTITVTVTDNSGRTNSATSTSISTKQDKLNFDTKCGYRFDQAAHESSPTRTIDIDVVTEEDWYGNGWNCTVSCDKYSFSVYKFQSLGIIEAQYTVKSSSSRWNEFTFTMTCTDKNGIKGSVTKTYSPSNCSLEYDNSF